MKVLLLRLEAPLMSFGGVAVDSLGVIDDFPSASLVTGLLGNALGYRRTATSELQQLQNRLRYAVRVDRTGQQLTEYQTAELEKADEAWTTRGTAEGRQGGAGSYSGQHQRFRDFHADAAVTVALYLEPPDSPPSIETLAQALDYPARPLFIGRKSCLPCGRLYLGMLEAESLVTALSQAEFAENSDADMRCFQLASADSVQGVRAMHGRRNWRSNVHQGAESWMEFTMRRNP